MGLLDGKIALSHLIDGPPKLFYGIEEILGKLACEQQSDKGAHLRGDPLVSVVDKLAPHLYLGAIHIQADQAACLQTGLYHIPGQERHPAPAAEQLGNHIGIAGFQKGMDCHPAGGQNLLQVIPVADPFFGKQKGFGKLVFVIRKDFEQEFKDKIISKYEGHIPCELVFQALDNLPEGFTCPEGRTKPWGTNHAVMMGADVIKEPFAVINCDDFYGSDSYRVMGEFLANLPEGAKNTYAMVGFRVGNTLSESGSVR